MMISFKDVPKDDLTAFQKYPKHQQVYQNRNLLELQKIHCSTVRDDLSQWQIPDYSFDQTITLIRQPPHTSSHSFQLGYFFSDPIEGDRFHADVAILKGNVVWSKSYTTLPDIAFIEENLSGNIELKLNALVSMYLAKFSGVIEIEIIGETIVSIHLRPSVRTIHLYNNELKDKISKLYNKHIW